MDTAFIETRGNWSVAAAEAGSLVSPSHNIISRLEGETLAVRLSDKDEVPVVDPCAALEESKPGTITSRVHLKAKMNHICPSRSAPPAELSAPSRRWIFIGGSFWEHEWNQMGKSGACGSCCVWTLGMRDRADHPGFQHPHPRFRRTAAVTKPAPADPNLQNLHNAPGRGVHGASEMPCAMCWTFQFNIRAKRGKRL